MPSAPAFAAEARLAVSAEASGGVEEVRRVDPDDAGLDARCGVERGLMFSDHTVAANP